MSRLSLPNNNVCHVTVILWINRIFKFKLLTLPILMNLRQVATNTNLNVNISPRSNAETSDFESDPDDTTLSTTAQTIQNVNSDNQQYQQILRKSDSRQAPIRLVTDSNGDHMKLMDKEDHNDNISQPLQPQAHDIDKRTRLSNTKLKVQQQQAKIITSQTEQQRLIQRHRDSSEYDSESDNSIDNQESDQQSHRQQQSDWRHDHHHHHDQEQAPHNSKITPKTKSDSNYSKPEILQQQESDLDQTQQFIQQGTVTQNVVTNTGTPPIKSCKAAAAAPNYCGNNADKTQPANQNLQDFAIKLNYNTACNTKEPADEFITKVKPDGLQIHFRSSANTHDARLHVVPGFHKSYFKIACGPTRGYRSQYNVFGNDTLIDSSKTFCIGPYFESDLWEEDNAGNRHWGECQYCPDVADTTENLYDKCTSQITGSPPSQSYTYNSKPISPDSREACFKQCYTTEQRKIEFNQVNNDTANSNRDNNRDICNTRQKKTAWTKIDELHLSKISSAIKWRTSTTSFDGDFQNQVFIGCSDRFKGDLTFDTHAATGPGSSYSATQASARFCSWPNDYGNQVEWLDGLQVEVKDQKQWGKCQSCPPRWMVMEYGGLGASVTDTDGACFKYIEQDAAKSTGQLFNTVKSISFYSHVSLGQTYVQDFKQLNIESCLNQCSINGAYGLLRKNEYSIIQQYDDAIAKVNNDQLPFDTQLQEELLNVLTLPWSINPIDGKYYQDEQLHTFIAKAPRSRDPCAHLQDSDTNIGPWCFMSLWRSSCREGGITGHYGTLPSYEGDDQHADLNFNAGIDLRTRTFSEIKEEVRKWRIGTEEELKNSFLAIQTKFNHSVTSNTSISNGTNNSLNDTNYGLRVCAGWEEVCNTKGLNRFRNGDVNPTYNPQGLGAVTFAGTSTNKNFALIRHAMINLFGCAYGQTFCAGESFKSGSQLKVAAGVTLWGTCQFCPNMAQMDHRQGLLGACGLIKIQKGWSDDTLLSCLHMCIPVEEFWQARLTEQGKCGGASFLKNCTHGTYCLHASAESAYGDCHVCPHLSESTKQELGEKKLETHTCEKEPNREHAHFTLDNTKSLESCKAYCEKAEDSVTVPEGQEENSHLLNQFFTGKASMELVVGVFVIASIVFFYMYNQASEILSPGFGGHGGNEGAWHEFRGIQKGKGKAAANVAGGKGGNIKGGNKGRAGAPRAGAAPPPASGGGGVGGLFNF